MESYNCESSAKKWFEILYGQMMLLSGYVYIVNSTGPRTDSWDTPYFKNELSEMEPSIITLGFVPSSKT